MQDGAAHRRAGACEDTADGLTTALELELDLAIAGVARAEAIAGRVALLREPGPIYLELLAAARRQLARAQAYTRNTEAWLARQDEAPASTLQDRRIARLIDTLEDRYRARAQACAYHLSLLEPAPVRLHGLCAAGAANGERRRAEGAAAALDRDRATARGAAGFEAEKPGRAPLIDHIDPRHQLRRQLAAAGITLAHGLPARVQIQDVERAAGIVFVRLDPVAGPGVRLQSRPQIGAGTTAAPVLPRHRLDPVTVLAALAVC